MSDSKNSITTVSVRILEKEFQVSCPVGEVDALINNAGIIQPFVKVNELTMEQAKKVMDVNFYGPLALVKAFLPGLLKRPEAHILNVSSMCAYAPVPGQSVYGASKAAIKLLTEGLHSELMETQVGTKRRMPRWLKSFAYFLRRPSSCGGGAVCSSLTP